MKKRIALGVCIMIGLGMLLFPSPRGEWKQPETEKDSAEGMGKAVAVLEGELTFLGECCSVEGVVLEDHRFYLPWEQTERWMEEAEPGYLQQEMEATAIREVEQTTYIRINDFCERWELWPVFTDGGIALYRYDFGWEPKERQPEEMQIENIACLRLEDIMADPREDGRFTHEKLEKLRILVRWLSDHGQEYSVAWIPIFVDPNEGIINDLTEIHNWYNVDFLYTLDMMAANGGHMGVHGLTHQFGGDISADGWEFGETSPFTLKEAEARMMEAKAVAAELGYEVEFFEFPHYGMTKAQGKLAERHFDVIYQQEPWTKPYGYVETKQVGGRTVMYVPTPADCVQSIYDSEGILQRLTASHDEGKLVSLFFHPSLDYEKIGVTTGEDGVRTLSYEENRGILSGIVRQIEKWEMQFGVVW